jgi:hypothetical protein
LFELIGMAFVAWIVWMVGKSIVSGLINGTLVLAGNHAASLGVPRDFIDYMIANPDVVKHARRELALGDREFSALDAYEQYGKSIVHLHVKARQIEVLRVKNEVGKIFRHQCEQLYDYSACSISALYISALTITLARIAPTQLDIREVFDHCFEHPNLAFSRNIAWIEMMNSPNSHDDLLAMVELVEREIAAQKFEFFYNLRNKYMENYQQGIHENDLSDVDPHWYLKI